MRVLFMKEGFSYSSYVINRAEVVVNAYGIVVKHRYDRATLGTPYVAKVGD